MANKSYRFILLSALLILCSSALGQNIKSHYVSRSMPDGTIYHTVPVTLFENSENGSLTFDLTYKQNSKAVTMNFTYWAKQAMPADSVQFICGATVIAGTVDKFYIEPDKKLWKHRYSLSENIDKFASAFSNKGETKAIIYSKGKAYTYSVKKSAWNEYAPIGFKIFEMIKLNEGSIWPQSN